MINQLFLAECGLQYLCCVRLPCSSSPDEDARHKHARFGLAQECVLFIDCSGKIQTSSTIPAQRQDIRTVIVRPTIPPAAVRAVIGPARAVIGQALAVIGQACAVIGPAPERRWSDRRWPGGPCPGPVRELRIPQPGTVRALQILGCTTSNKYFFVFGSAHYS